MKKYACVTGAERGLGYELTKSLLKRGYYVFALRYRSEWNQLDTLKQSYQDELTIIQTDISQDESVKNAYKIISETTSSIDYLINNGAITGDNSSVLGNSLDYDEILSVFNVNAVGALRVTNEFYPLIKVSERKIVVNISSEAGSISDCNRQGWFAYCTSKAGLNMISAITHNNLLPLGGQVIIFHPGWMKTWLSGHFNDQGPLTPDIPAEKIVEYLETKVGKPTNHPLYIDYLGQPLSF